MATLKGNILAKKRRTLRDELWTDAEGQVWSRKSEKGFTSVPRTLPLICVLLRHLGPGNPSLVYLDLWSRAFDEGLVEIVNEHDVAAACGFGTRVRTWREHIKTLETLGFIRTRPKGSQPYGHILLIHPHVVAYRLREKMPDRVPDPWWNLFEDRVRTIGAKQPWVKEPAEPETKAADVEDADENLFDDDSDMPF